MMKYLFFLLIIFTLNTPLLIAQSWEQVSVGTGYVAADINLVFDSTNAMYLGYRGSNHANVMKFNGITWDSVGNRDFSKTSTGGIQDVHLIKGDSSDFFIAYSDNPTFSGGKISVMRYDGISWSYVGPQRFTAGNAYYPKLARDPLTGTLYVAFQNGAASNKVSVMKFNGTSWVYVGTTGISGSTANFPSLMFDLNGTLYVSFRDFWDAKAFKFDVNSNSWVTTGFIPTSTSVDYVDMTKDKLGNLYMVFSDQSTPKKASVAKYNGTSWSLLGSANFTPNEARNNRIIVNDLGEIYVLFNDVALTNALSVMTFDGTNWVTVGQPGFSNINASSRSLALDTAGVPYVGYTNTSGLFTIKKLSCKSLSSINVTTCSYYNSPSGMYIWDTAGVYQDTLYGANAKGCDSILTINLTIAPLNVSVTYNGTSLTANAAGAAYQWLDCNNNFSPIVGETNSTFTPSANGNYAVEITDNNCTDTSACEQVVGVGLNKLLGEVEAVIFPNPTNDVLTIQTNEIIEQVLIFDAHGRLIQSENQKTFSVKDLSVGVYILQLKSTNKIRTIKLIKY